MYSFTNELVDKERKLILKSGTIFILHGDQIIEGEHIDRSSFLVEFKQRFVLLIIVKHGIKTSEELVQSRMLKVSYYYILERSKQ